MFKTLIVEDNPTFRQSLRGLLFAQFPFMEIDEAGSGKEGVDIYKANKEMIHMVILDMIMPDMAGGETYDRLKEIDPDVKVLLSSGYGINGQATEILERGCNGFIQKPFDMKELSRELGKMLDV